LRGDALALEIRKSLEQIWQGKFPEILVHRNFGYFARNKLSDLVRSDRTLAVVAHPGGASFDRVSHAGGHDSLVVGIGSEGGWSESELGELERLGFARLGLGQRVVRVELAVLYILGQSLVVFE
jgi:RsmE family RNA methyltransferase